MAILTPHSPFKKLYLWSLYVMTIFIIGFITFTGWVYVTVKEKTNVFPYELVLARKPDENIEAGFNEYIMSYPDYSNGSNDTMFDSIIYNREPFSYYSFIYPSDFDLSEVEGVVVLSPGTKNKLFQKSNDIWFSIEKSGQKYSEKEVTESSTADIVSGDIKGKRITVGETEKYILSNVNDPVNSYIITSYHKSPASEQTLQKILSSFRIYITSIKVPRLIYPYAYLKGIFE